jgi:hypothetical protein
LALDLGRDQPAEKTGVSRLQQPALAWILARGA